jgi:chromate transporter
MPDGVFVGTGQFVSAKPGGIFVTGLIAGLITFGGAYTTIPFLREAAVIVGAWMTEQQFIDGLGIVQVLPTPLVMITT